MVLFLRLDLAGLEVDVYEIVSAEFNFAQRAGTVRKPPLVDALFAILRM
jgi:hypothetical protein